MYVATFLSSIYIDYSAHGTSIILKVITSSRTNEILKLQRVDTAARDTRTARCHSSPSSAKWTPKYIGIK
uniref:Uncharacterized protein n=1 Tax=Moniliophthora roreri TaxID=221103 RepID=A0A0W0FYP9_MONRR